MSSTFADFFVKQPNGDGSFTFLPGLTIKGYNVSISSDLGTIGTSASDGKIAGGSITATDGDLIRFRVESNSHGQCGFCQTMAGSSLSQDLVIKPSSGVNAIARPQARKTYRPVATTTAAYAEVFYLLDGDPIRSAVSLGIFPIGQEVHLAVNPPTDRTYTLIPMPYNRWGVPSFANLSDAYDAVLNSVSMNRDIMPTVAQAGTSTTNQVTLSISITEFTRLRKLRIADNIGMSGAAVQVYDHTIDKKPMPLVLDIFRTASINPSSTGYFTWTGTDPVSNGFTKSGSGTTQTDPGGWRINTLSTNLATSYSKSSWPGSAFSAGFSIEVAPPTINSSTGGALPNQSAIVAVDDSSKRYELTWDASNVKLNGGSSHAHSGAKVRLVIASGGATADLWIGSTKVETATANIATVATGLFFGDLATTDDSDVVWKSVTYARTIAPPQLAQTIYVAVSHSSGGAYTTETTPLALTFANEGTGGGGSTGPGDVIYREEYNL